MYLMRVAMVRFNNIYLYTIYFFFCGMIFMGWFDFYFAGVIVFELPLMLLFLLLFEKMLYKKQNDTENEDCNNTD
jgi:ABC-type bacteriocin/lantibiotic exporter with double-glycine peptidase domain